MTTNPQAPHGRRPRTLAPAIALALAVFATGAGVTAGPAAAADPVPAVGAVPACTRGDDPAPFRRYREWRSTFLDTRYRLSHSYLPPRLRSTADAGLDGGHRVRRLVLDDLAAMRRAARGDGVPLRVTSGYRSWEQQRALYRSFVDRLGPERAALRAARPGHSEHQLGTALDFADTDGSWAWLAANGWRHGFVVSYPRGARDVSCYRSEPWHVRYYGPTRAAAIQASELVPRAWLWVNVVAGTR
jgi:D-alanyl-D-alanine carboxypeptidase